IDRMTRGSHALDRGTEWIERLACILRRILDRQPRDSSPDCGTYVSSEFLRIAGKAVLKISIQRHIGGRGQGLEMLEGCFECRAPVRAALRPGEPGTRRGERFEAETLQKARTANIPWIGNDEAAARVQTAEAPALIGDAGSPRVHAGVSGAARCPVWRLP